MSDLTSGDKVKWTYTHHLNSRSSKRITKRGVFIATIRSEHVDGGCRITTSHYCRVQFEGNKNPSKVLVSELIND